jgi:ABC-type Fe3+-siderophore transport system permease subunit
MAPRWKQRLGGLFMTLLGAAGTLWVWNTALSDGTLYDKASMVFPAFCVVGLGLMLFPGYREERLARDEDISRMQGWRLLTPRWWAIVIVAVLTGLGNYLLLSLR